MSPTHELVNLAIEFKRKCSPLLHSKKTDLVLNVKKLVAGVHGISCCSLAMATSYVAGSGKFRIEINGNSYARACGPSVDSEILDMIALNIGQIVKLSIIAEKNRRHGKIRKLVAELYSVMDDANRMVHGMNKGST